MCSASSINLEETQNGKLSAHLESDTMQTISRTRAQISNSAFSTEMQSYVAEDFVLNANKSYMDTSVTACM